MPKRKRSDEDGDERPDAGLSVRQKRVRFKIDGATKSLAQAFKLAKGFERQKLGRRMKKAVADGNDKDVERITAEVAATKALEPARPAQLHLFKSLMRIKAVAEHHNLPEEVRVPGVLATDTPTLNVNARLCNSNPVQTCLKEVLRDIQRALGLEPEDIAIGKKQRVRAKDLEKDEKADKSEKAAKPVKKPRHHEDEDGDVEIDEVQEAHDDQLSGSGDSENEASDIADLERRLAQEGVKPSKSSTSTKAKPYSLEDDLEILDADSRGSSASPEPQKSASAAPPKKSSFIPSLTLGGYISGSGSDFEDDTKLDLAPRKNRRGQRARQKIWEQKYGQKANHVQKQQHDASRSRDHGWDAKRGATHGGPRRGGHGRGFDREKSRGDAKSYQSKPDRVAGNAKPRDDSGPIHPSWEAAKRAKEKKDAPVAFAGKKTTFD